jgi:hypothetical protein
MRKVQRIDEISLLTQGAIHSMMEYNWHEVYTKTGFMSTYRNDEVSTMINNNPMRQTAFSLPPVLYRSLKEEADSKAQSVSAMIRLILAERYAHKLQRGGTSDEAHQTSRSTPIAGTPH